MGFTLFWLVTMSSTLPKTPWGEVYSFVRPYTKHWHAFMRFKTATQELQNGDFYTWTGDDEHAWRELMQAMEDCHSRNGDSTLSLQDSITSTCVGQSSGGDLPQTSQEEISNVNRDPCKPLAPLFDKYNRSADQGTGKVKAWTWRLRRNLKHGPKVGILRKSA